MNSFGRIFRISIFGESHGPIIGVLIDGCPAGISIQMSDFEIDLDRRRPGKIGTTTRIESDLPQIISGIYNGFSTGTPICITFTNENIISSDYLEIKDLARPGHADFTIHSKFKGFADRRGGGHSSGRLTLGIVAAGVIAKKILPEMEIESKLIEVNGSNEIDNEISKAVEGGYSVGGIVECIAKNIPIGLGEPFFDSLESYISHLAFSIPAVKGIEFGSGFQSTKMKGNDHNDIIIDETGKTNTNHSGGINAGISNGNEIIFRLAIKPTSSISNMQNTINLLTGEKSTIEIIGRHDSCIALRVPVVAEAITAIALADLSLIQKSC
jgi:chorismate synthase